MRRRDPRRLRLAVIGVMAFALACRGASERRLQDDEAPPSTTTASIGIDDYRDKLWGSLHGQLFGLAWGFARGIEFRYRRRTVPDDDFPDWRSEVHLNAALRAPAGDDFYNELSGVLAMRDFGPAVTWVQMEPFYRDTEYPVWHSDARMRENLRRGIAAPDCGHYRHQMEGEHGHSDDLDAQMQVDFCGATNPGNPNAALVQAWKFGHLMGYGDGVIGAAVIAAMNAEAYVATDVDQIVLAGLAAAPAGSRYRKLLEDVVAWHDRWPDDWMRTWRGLDEAWGADDRCPDGSSGGRKGEEFNIDAKLHGGFILIGLLYGRGDFLRSLEITIRCGQDTDTSAQNLGSILGAFLGREGLPSEVTGAGPDADATVEGTDLTLAEVAALYEELARASVPLSGGVVRGDGEREVWTVRREPLIAPILEQWPRRPNAPPALEARIDSVDGLTVVCSARATDEDGIGAYQWHFGDLTHADGAQVRHTYPRSGTFEAVCYVTDGIGHTSLERVRITVGSD